MGVFDSFQSGFGNALAMGAQMQAARPQQPAPVGPQVSVPIMGQNALMSPQEALELQQGQQDRQYEISRRPMQEAQAGADLENTMADTGRIREQARALAADAAGKMDDNQRRQTMGALMSTFQGAQWAAEQGNETWDRFVMSRADEIREELRVEPSELTFEYAPMIIDMLQGQIEGVRMASELPASELVTPTPRSPQGKLAADVQAGFLRPGEVETGPEWRAANPDEAQARGAAAGQINTQTGEFKAINPPSGMSVEVGADGTMRMTQGPGVTDPRDESNPSTPAAMISSIDGILDDPAFDSATGMRAWMQGIPGTEARRFGSRMRQLEGQAFLQAFESLKGGGQITEIEGQKATQAIGRLDSAQRPEDLREALNELRDILNTGMSRPEGWADQQGDASSRDWPTLENGRPDWSSMSDDQMESYFRANDQ